MSTTTQEECICPYCDNHHASLYLLIEEGETTFCDQCGYYDALYYEEDGSIYRETVKRPYAAYEYITTTGTKYFGTIRSKTHGDSYTQDCMEDERCDTLIFHRYVNGKFSEVTKFSKSLTNI